ncbi:MAG: glycosyltransferase family 2 protein [Deltaproteobacteria bacterium]
MPLPISVCAIVRDEEQNLPRLIASVREIAAEIVVVDTGSTDRTVEIARQHGARVLHTPWTDDFSAARNVYLQAATSDWILALDGDEELLADSVECLNEAVTSGALAQLVRVRFPCGVEAGASADDSVPDKNALRLFRRDPRVRYGGRIHENIIDSLLAIGAGQWPDSGAVIIHHGYVRPEDRERKRARNLVLLERAFADSPHDLYIGYKYAATLETSDHVKAAAVLDQVLTLACSTPDLATYPFLPAALALGCRVFLRGGELQHAMRIVQLLGDSVGGTAVFTKGYALALGGVLDRAQLAFEAYLAQTPASQLLEGDPEASEAAAARWLGWIALMSGDYSLAHERIEAARSAAVAAGLPVVAMAAECDRIRLLLATDQTTAAARAMGELAPRAVGGPAFRELMLASADLSFAVGDATGAAQLAFAAIDPTGRDDRGAAMAALFHLFLGEKKVPDALALLPKIPGQRWDTLAVRLLLEDIAIHHFKDHPNCPAEPYNRQAVPALTRGMVGQWKSELKLPFLQLDR